MSANPIPNLIQNTGPEPTARILELQNGNLRRDSVLDAIQCCQNTDRASILLYDSDNAIRFNAWRRLSDEYRRVVEGHSPWKPDDPDPQPVCMDDVATVPLEPHLRDVIEREGIRALAFIPIRVEKRLLGKFMIYYNAPHCFVSEELRPVETVAVQIAFAIERQRAVVKRWNGLSSSGRRPSGKSSRRWRNFPTASRMICALRCGRCRVMRARCSTITARGWTTQREAIWSASCAAAREWTG